MKNQPAASTTQLDFNVLDRARAVTDAVVEEQGARLATALESGNVADIEAAFYRVFVEVYAKGYEDGSLHARQRASTHPAVSKTQVGE
jgi:hypothetical protein